IGFDALGIGWLSAVVLVASVASWLLLAAVFAARLGSRPGRWVAEADRPAALTGAAATAVLGVRVSLSGAQDVAAGLLALAAALTPPHAVPGPAGAAAAARILSEVLLGIALAWYVVLAYCEARWWRPRYDVRRWSTVFPLAMTALATLSTGAVAGSVPLTR